ncbi:hypothetical protein SCHPADRAFT_891934 [Schizopora paradoxa]|uniref:Uncharacterized protein n=1 Tax=Schizopora paradoxa TaxID=27342 RepID=A0A0H2RGM6_9AGAM|nr:hypothetical protein SCHPADRAFT_891934 [Schizopora paradoxa]
MLTSIVAIAFLASASFSFLILVNSRFHIARTSSCITFGIPSPPELEGVEVPSRSSPIPRATSASRMSLCSLVFYSDGTPPAPPMPDRTMKGVLRRKELQSDEED